jgi:hypothetical protein
MDDTFPDRSNAAPNEGQARERHPVLEVFGVKLEVTNPRLAELLTMDAAEALTTDIRKLGGTAAEAAPVLGGIDEVQLDQAAPKVVDEEEARRRKALHAAVLEVGTSLGFDARPDGLWQSPTGIVVLTRTVEQPVSYAAATHFVTELAARRESIAGPESTALFVVDGQQTVDVFRVAIRQNKLYDLMRTISLDNLMAIRDLYAHGVLNHTTAVALLVPMANIDVGEIISLVRAASEANSEPRDLG